MSKKPKVKSKSKFYAETFATVPARWEFSKDEIIGIADELNRQMAERDQLELNKKSVASEFSAKIKSLNGEIRKTSEKIANRSEQRETEVRVEFDAKNRIKTYFRVTDGKKVGEAAMSEHDFQMWFPLPVEKPKVPKTVVQDAFEKAETKKAEKEAAAAS